MHTYTHTNSHIHIQKFLPASKSHSKSRSIKLSSTLQYGHLLLAVCQCSLGCVSWFRRLVLHSQAASDWCPWDGEEEPYSAENLRRVARSLSGTAIGTQRQRLAVSRSFVSLSFFLRLSLSHT